jgi:hypothetical protein
MLDPDVSYVWLPPEHFLVEPVRATLLSESAGSCWDTIAEFHGDPRDDSQAVKVTLHHPDVGDIPSIVATQDLRGRWDEPPLRSLVEESGWKPDRTWEQIAVERHAWVAQQRLMTDRLTKLGIVRRRRHYAGRGGTSGDVRLQLDCSLMLSPQEWTTLLDLAERGNT